MLKEALLEYFERDLILLKNEINLYPTEEDLWKTAGGISNSAGNLCLHLIGNMKHFIGAVLGESGFVRERDKEFSAKNVTRQDLIKEIENTIEIVKISLNKLSDEDLNKDFPVEKRGKIVGTDFMLLHLLTHFNYHLGQINYHRRLL